MIRCTFRAIAVCCLLAVVGLLVAPSQDACNGQTGKPTIDSRNGTLSSFNKTAKPTPGNRDWTWDPFSKTAKPTPANRDWTWDPFSKTAKPNR